MFDEEIPEPKPLVEYAYVPEDEDEKEERKHQDFMDSYFAKQKFPFSDFGKNGKKMDVGLQKEIQKFHERQDPQKKFIPYEIHIENEKNLIGPAIPKEIYLQQYEQQKNTSYQKNDLDIPNKEPFINKKNKAEDKDEDIDSDSESDDDKNDNENEALEKKIPISHVVELKHGNGKNVTSLDIDRAGNRLVSGCFDGTIKIWDFSGLTRKPESFQTVDAGDGYPVLATCWAPTGGFFLACTGDCQAKVYDRDGNFEIECLKGDNYLHDISNTKGHTYPLTDGKWHPMDRNIFITASRDSTIRIWDIYSKPCGIDQELMQTSILRASTYKNHKITIGCCAYSQDGNIIVGGVNDGSLQFWYNKSNHWKPDLHIPNAHGANNEITSILFFEDNLRFVSRGEDSTMKLWDLRRPKKPLFVFEDLPCFSTKTGMALSGDESILLTGTCVKKGHENSKLAFYSTYNYEKIKDVPICQNSIVSLVWSDKINQIAASTNDGLIRVYFDPDKSKNGVINSIYKSAKKVDIDDFNYMKPIITPLVLPLFDETTFDRKMLLEKIKPEDNPQLKAELPQQGPGSKFARPPSVTQYIMKVVNQTIYDEGDPRDVLLKFGDEKVSKNEWVAPAYAKTQPKPVFDYTGPIEDEVKYYEQSNKKICPACGLKFCQCTKTIFQLPIPKYTPPKYKNF